MKNKILIVDDELVARESLKKLLSSYGKCEAVSNGDSALEAFQEAHNSSEPYTLITLDIDMKGMDGMDLLRNFRKLESLSVFPKRKRAQIIMISATKEVEQNTVKSYFLDSEAYIVKPATKEKLDKCLERLEISPDSDQG